jgi:hypothetical protein
LRETVRRYDGIAYSVNGAALSYGSLAFSKNLRSGVGSAELRSSLGYEPAIHEVNQHA